MVLAEDLRQAIIQQAIQGKLTKQLGTDGNVDILLKEIEQEKTKFMVENKRKPEPKLAAYDESDIPFEIPANWRWCQLGDIISYQNGYAFKSSDMSKGVNGYPVIKSQNLMTLKVVIKDGNDRIEFPDEKMLLCQIRKNDLLMCLSSQSSNPEPLGKTAIYESDEPALLNQRVLKMTLMKMDMLYYIFYVINSAYFHYDVSHKGDGSAQSNLKLEHVREMLIPLPPIEEQQRIVDKINEIMPKIDEYEKIEKELETLKKEFPNNMKDALLQAAMQGKLTEQLENDSNVDELLTAIQKEKDELIAQKKIKKEKPLPDIEEEEIPFDIPESWRWVRMGNVIKLTSGQDLQPDKYSDNNIGIPYFTGASNFQNGDLVINRYTSSGTSMAYNGDLLLTCKGTIGEMAFMYIEKAHIARQIMSISKIDNINLKYIKLCLENFILKLKANARSIIPGIDRKVILGLPIPLPPIEEQQRIVERLDMLLPLCEDLKEERIVS